MRVTNTNLKKKNYAYASKEPLAIKGAFTCEIKCRKWSTQAEFVVIKEKGESLLGKETENQGEHSYKQ